MAGAWGCPHEVNDICTMISNLPCNPGMKGCVLYGRYVFADDDKNERLRRKAASRQAHVPEPVPEPDSSEHP